MNPARVPRAMRMAPLLDPHADVRPPRARHVLLINPFYPKDPHASFGKHVLTPSLALTSIAGSTPPEWSIQVLGRKPAPRRAALRSVPAGRGNHRASDCNLRLRRPRAR